jgi:hypothetical protein
MNLIAKAAPTGLACSSIHGIGGMAPISEVNSAYPINRPDSSREKIKVTFPACTNQQMRSIEC